MKITPKNWKQFQHYKDRNPVWIKLHRSLLNDYEWHCLPVASKALAPCLWLLASEYQDGTIDAPEKAIAFRLHMSVDELISALKPLIDNGFFKSDSSLLAERYQDACLETERETETEREKEKRERRSQARGTRLSPDWMPSEHLEETHELEKFRDYWIAQPGQRGVKTDWDATWRNWVRRAAERTPARPSGNRIANAAKEMLDAERSRNQSSWDHPVLLPFGKPGGN
jgi:hypothetical protein